MPFGVYSSFREVQLLEIEARVAKQARRKFNGELSTTTMMYRTFHFAENPEGSFLFKIAQAKLQWMIKNSKKWMVTFLLGLLPFLLLNCCFFLARFSISSFLEIRTERSPSYGIYRCETAQLYDSE